MMLVPGEELNGQRVSALCLRAVQEQMSIVGLCSLEAQGTVGSGPR